MDAMFGWFSEARTFVAFESRQAVFVPGELLGEDFDGYVAAELGVFGAVDLSHAAVANRLEDLVVS